MKLQLNNQSDSLLIHSWAFGSTQNTTPNNDEPNSDKHYRIRIADTWYQQSLILTPRAVKLWEVVDVPALAISHFEQLAELVAKTGAEVVLLGTGKRAIFPHPALAGPLMRQRIGLEVMDTAAACRTYNVLAADGRPALAALIV